MTRVLQKVKVIRGTPYKKGGFVESLFEASERDSRARDLFFHESSSEEDDDSFFLREIEKKEKKKKEREKLICENFEDQQLQKNQELKCLGENKNTTNIIQTQSFANKNRE